MSSIQTVRKGPNIYFELALRAARYTSSSR
jgi:hypothetical protein